MKKHILIFCLALALCLSMIPAAGAVYAAPSYTVIATGIEATDVDILDNGYCGYIVYDGYEIPRKGIIAPSGKAIVTRAEASVFISNILDAMMPVTTDNRM